MKKISLFVLLVFGIQSFVNAQSITGQITNALDGTPLPGTSISITEKNNGTIADENGFFNLKLAEDGEYNLKASFIGFETRTFLFSVAGSETKKVNIQLKPSFILQEEIIVSANKINTSRDQVPLTISVINEKQIEQSSESNVLPVISSQVPGLFVTERGISGFGLAPGSAGKISIRGVGGSGSSFPVLVLIDGQPQFMGIFGHPIPDSYASSDIEKVEVIKGPASILYGTNAMGGVINMITKKNKEDGLHFKGRGMLGSYSTWKLNGSGSYKKDKFSAFASWNHDETDGHRANSAFKIDNGFVKLAYELSDHFSVSANINRSDFKAYDAGSIYAEDPSIYDNNAYYVDIVRTNTYATISNKFDKIEGGLKLYYMHGDHLVTNGPSPDWNSIDENIGLSFYQGIRLVENNLISIGVDYKKYGGKGSPVMIPRFENGQLVGMIPSAYNNKWVSINETGAYMIVQHQFNRLTLNSGVRIDNHSLYGNEVVPQFGLAYNASDNTKLKASVSKGFRNPSIRELYLFPPANANLDPERMWNYELGWTQYFWEKRLSFTTNVYLAKGDNLIMTLPNPSPPPAVLNVNSGDFTHKGFEIDSKYRITNKVNLHASYSYLNMDNPKIASPEHQLFVGGSYHLYPFDFNLQVQHIGNLYTNINPESIQDYTLLNAKVNYHINKNMNVFVSGENLFDVKYEVQHGYPMPGATVFSGIEVNF